MSDEPALEVGSCSSRAATATVGTPAFRLSDPARAVLAWRAAIAGWLLFSDGSLPKSSRIDSSTGSMYATCLVRMTKFHRNSNFFQPAAYAKCLRRAAQAAFDHAPLRIDPQR